MLPLKIKVVEDARLYIKWDDDSESEISLEKLRKFCPCATCISDKEKQSRTYIPLFNQNQIRVMKLDVVGNYAINITWKDGHNTGIYEFPYLSLLAKENIQL